MTDDHALSGFCNEHQRYFPPSRGSCTRCRRLEAARAFVEAMMDMESEREDLIERLVDLVEVM